MFFIMLCYIMDNKNLSLSNVEYKNQVKVNLFSSYILLNPDERKPDSQFRKYLLQYLAGTVINIVGVCSFVRIVSDEPNYFIQSCVLKVINDIVFVPSTVYFVGKICGNKKANYLKSVAGTVIMDVVSVATVILIHGNIICLLPVFLFPPIGAVIGSNI